MCIYSAYMCIYEVSVCVYSGVKLYKLGYICLVMCVYMPGV